MRRTHVLKRVVGGAKRSRMVLGGLGLLLSLPLGLGGGWAGAALADDGHHHDAHHHSGHADSVPASVGSGDTADTGPVMADAGPATADAGPVMDERLRGMLGKEFPTAPYTTMSMGHMMSEGVPLHGGGSGPGMVSLYPKDPSVETVSLTGGLCPPGAPARSYNISAITLQITYNRFLDYDPEGRMYVLTENVGAALAEAAQNQQARAGQAQPAVSLGLQGDVIQPLVIRANQGDCLTINFSNNMSNGESASIHLHNSSLIVAGANVPAIAANPAAMAPPGGSVTYQWFIASDTQEGTYYFHSHGNDREQAAHGLFGAVIVEKAGSTYLNPWTGVPLKSGWIATIQPSSGASFREFAVFYHEVGNDNFRHRDKNDNLIVMADFVTGSYKWGGRALNYRSEPFRNRLLLINQQHGFFDESMAYGSYTNGDPPTPVPRSYLGEPIKWRLVHGGSEVWHVHHYHGGAIRWKRQPGTGDTRFDVGLSKFPPVTPDTQEPGRPAPSFSDFVDAQSIGPSETYDIEDECGSGGCQQTVGDFLWHCHVGHHYLGGMWSFHRVYNTLQNGPASTDTMPALMELPDRQGRMKTAVSSSALVGTTVDWFSNQTQGGISGTKYQIVSGPTNLSASPPQFNIADWVEQQLPPQGKPGNAADEEGQIQAYDATVLDWMKLGTVYLNEPETSQSWPDYTSQGPGVRFPFKFDPTTGKLAYPFLRPHLGKRAPFPPNHGPAPFLEPIHLNPDGTRSTEPAKPGENGLWSLCPEHSPENSGGTPRKFFSIHALPVPIPLNPDATNLFGQPMVDPDGQIFVLHEERSAVLADDTKKVPLAIRANARDCVDVTFKSELLDTFENFFLNKINIHIHFVQFDPQGSDGVITGFNYEGSIRPFTIIGQTGMQQPMNTTLAANASSGATTITVTDASHFHPNTELGIGMDQPGTFEVKRIQSIAGNTITLTKPLDNSHNTGEFVSVEFLRFRWYPDVQNGITYFHDHVNAIRTWKHGQFGAIVIEPPHSTYHDPSNGAEIRSGIVADIHTSEKLTTDVTGSFRELVTLIQDDNPTTRFNPIGTTGSTGSSINLRVEPLTSRFSTGDPSVAFSSLAHGDPHTHIVQAFLGDPVVIRMHQTGAHETHTLHVDGHWWRGERFSPLSVPKNTQHVGIAERYDLVIPHAGGPQQKPGDYLYQNGRRSKLREGGWGLLRVHGQAVGGLQTLPGRTIPPSPPGTCPSTAPFKDFTVVAMDKVLDFGNGTSINGRIYALEEDVPAIQNGALALQPLVLHVNVGECVKVLFKNQLASGRASFHVDKMAYNPQESYGANVGFDQLDQTAGPGEFRVYTFYAHPEFGEGGALVRDFGNVLDGPRNGLFGAIIVGPSGAQYFDPFTGEDVSKKSRVAVDVVRPALQIGSPVQIGNTFCQIQAILNQLPLLSLVQLFCQTPDQNQITITTPIFNRYRDYALFFQDEDEKIGVFTIPYPEVVTGLTGVNYKAAPLSQRSAFGPQNAFRADLLGDPPTPVFQAFVGDPVVFHAFGPSNEQNQVFSIENHQWPLERFMPGADLLASHQFGGTEVIDAYLTDGAGGAAGLPGNYLWLNHRLPYLDAGQWGYFRVCGAVALPGSPTCSVRQLAVQGTLPSLSGSGGGLLGGLLK